MVCACSLALLAVYSALGWCTKAVRTHGLLIHPLCMSIVPQHHTQEVAEFTCTCERYVGTESGGMDQAISVMGLPGTALKVQSTLVNTPRWLYNSFVHHLPPGGF